MTTLSAVLTCINLAFLASFIVTGESTTWIAIAVFGSVSAAAGWWFGAMADAKRGEA